MLKQCTGNCLS